MGGCEGRHRAHRGTKLRCCTVEVPDSNLRPGLVAKVAACWFVSCLLISAPTLLSAAAAAGITELAKDRSQRRVGTGEIWLQANGLVQSIGGIGQLIHWLQDCT